MNKQTECDFTCSFYLLQCLKMVCQDMFFSRSRATPTSRSLAGGEEMTGRAALEAAFKVTKSTGDKESVVGELLDLKINDSIDAQYSDKVPGIIRQCHM